MFGQTTRGGGYLSQSGCERLHLQKDKFRPEAQQCVQELEDLKMLAACLLGENSVTSGSFTWLKQEVTNTWFECGRYHAYA